MSATVADLGTPISLEEAMRFAWLEADFLDHALYEDWLGLWGPGAMYVVPIKPDAEDFENSLNYAYDDDAMRRKRVDRLVSGQSVSASPVARTVRLLSRFRLLGSTENACELRCAQILTEFRRDRERMYTANVKFRLSRTPSGFFIDEKVVYLLNGTAALSGIGYIL